MKKIEAYTLVEILVALTITSIIIVMAMSVYFQLSNTNIRILRDYDKNTDLLKLKSILSTDFERYETVEYSIYELNFKNQDSECIYEFTDFGILRRYQEKIDTFKLKYSDLEYEKQYGNTGMVTELSFSVQFHKEDLPYVFYKEYLNESKINKQIFE